MTEEQVEQWKQERRALKTNLDDALDLIDAYKKRVEELEAQIEKMKCCENCAKNGHICVAEEMQGKLCGKNKDKWKLRR